MIWMMTAKAVRIKPRASPIFAGNQKTINPTSDLSHIFKLYNASTLSRQAIIAVNKKVTIIVTISKTCLPLGDRCS